MKELYRKCRPKNMKNIVGQEEAVEVLSGKMKTNTIPHAILLYGPYGTGKTTLARIIARYLKCSRHDFKEQNTADYRGIDSVRGIRSVMYQAPIDGDVRIWLLDEVHEATSIAQDAMLKLLEDPPNHVYFILATTEPEKLSDGIRQRCLPIRLNPIDGDDLFAIIEKVCGEEKIKLEHKVMQKIAEYAGGSAREALQIVDKVRMLDSNKKQLQAIEKASVKTAAIEIARKLIKTGTKWRNVAPILRELQNEDPEQIRWMVLGYGKAVLLKSNNPRAYRMIQAFRDNFYECKFSGIISACYEIISGE